MRGHGYSGVLFVSTAAILTSLVIAVPQIISSPETIGVYVGQAAVLTCQISDPQDSEVSWGSVTYDFQISEADKILADDVTKFSVINVAGGQLYNLQILNVDKSDQGFYKCVIKGTNQQMISYLNILDYPSHLLPGESSLNMTDCCIKEGATPLCLPVCYPSQIDLTQFNLTSNCGTVDNLRAISKCFSGHSNHDNCCLNQNVDDVCLGICHSDVPENVNMDYLSRCFSDDVIKAVFKCFQTGLEILPGEPTEVHAISLCEDLLQTVLIEWKEPVKNPQKVTGYKIMYKVNTDETYSSVLVRNPKVHQYKLNINESRLMPNTTYKFHVSALANQGVSQKSIEVELIVADCSLFPNEQDGSIFVNPVNITITKVKKSGDVIVTWEVNQDLTHLNFTIFYKTKDATLFKSVQNVITKSYRLTNLKPRTEYTVYIIAEGYAGSSRQRSLEVGFVTDNVQPADDNIDDQIITDSEEDAVSRETVAIGFGIAFAIIILIAACVIIFVLLNRKNGFRSQKKDPVIFDNPGLVNLQPCETKQAPGIINEELHV